MLRNRHDLTYSKVCFKCLNPIRNHKRKDPQSRVEKKNNYNGKRYYLRVIPIRCDACNQWLDVSQWKRMKATQEEFEMYRMKREAERNDTGLLLHQAQFST